MQAVTCAVIKVLLITLVDNLVILNCVLGRFPTTIPVIENGRLLETLRSKPG